MTKFVMIRLWGLVVLMFGAASVLQVMLYAPRLWGGHPVWGRFPEWLYTPLVMVFFFGPGIAAALVAWRMVGRVYQPRSQGARVLAKVLVILLTIISCYVGVFISFNTWGT